MDRASKVTRALRSYAHTDHRDVTSWVKVSDGIDVVLTLYQNQLKQGVEVVRRYSDPDPIYCYADDLNQLWTNLIQNAVHAMDGSGCLEIDVKQVDGELRASFTDTGEGIPPELQSRIFEPFFTTKDRGSGSGIGLFVACSIAEKHDGSIAVESRPGRTVFTVTLPVDRLPAPSPVLTGTEAVPWD